MSLLKWVEKGDYVTYLHKGKRTVGVAAKDYDRRLGGVLVFPLFKDPAFVTEATFMEVKAPPRDLGTALVRYNGNIRRDGTQAPAGSFRRNEAEPEEPQPARE